MSQFVSDTVQLLVLYAVGGNPKCSDFTIVIATIGGAFQ